MFKRSLKLAAVFGLAVLQPGLADTTSPEQAPEQAGRRRFCQFAASQSSERGQPNPRRRDEPIDNREQRDLATLLSLGTPVVRVESRSLDWKNDADARALEVVASKPGFVMPQPGWSEPITPDPGDVIATLDDSRQTRMEIAGFHVCVQDNRGRVWFFRTVPVDGWIR